MIIMKLKPEYFDKIKNKTKTIEVRLNDDKRRKISIGDTIVFKKEPELYEGLVVKVVNKRFFNTFNDMALTLSLGHLGFEGKNIDEVVNVYRSIYSQEDEKKFGVVAFDIELIG